MKPYIKTQQVWTGKLFSSALFVCLIVLMTSCNKNRPNNSIAGDANNAEIALSEPVAVEEEPEPIERKLIKEGTLAFETADLKQTKNQIIQAIQKHKGYISSENESSVNNSLNHTIIVRVPAKQFDAFIHDATHGIDKFDTKDIQVKDVTEEFVDIQARLKTKKELEQRYLDLLKKANKISEILEIEKQIGDLRSDIEGTEGKLRYLANQASYSTVSISYYKSIPTQTAFGNKFKDGFSSGWDNFVWFLVGLVNIWPFILSITIIVYLLRRWWKRLKAKI